LLVDTYRKGSSLNPDREHRFHLLYEDHLARVIRFVARRVSPDDVQDVVSETFLTAWRRLENVPEDPVPWLFVTARNVISNRHRADGRQRALDDRLASLPKWQFETLPQLSELDQRLTDAINGLPEIEREALMLIAWDGLDRARAAKVAGCSIATLRVRLHRARRRLMKELGATHPFAPLVDLTSRLEESV